MNTRNSPAASWKHGIGVTAVVFLSIPGALTALSPIAMTWAPTGSQFAAAPHVLASARPAPAIHAG